MPTIVVANVDSAAMNGSRRDAEDYAHSAMSAQRLLAMTTDEDLILLPTQPSEEFIGYFNALLGRSLSEKNVVVPRRGEEDGLIWTYEALNDGDVAAQIAERVGDVRDWDLTAYFLDRAVLGLAETLGLELNVASGGFLRAGGAESLNSKVVFREIADAAGTPVAPGRVVDSARELAHSLRGLMEETGHAIVKQDLNLGGAGNTVFTYSDADEFTGARITVNVGGPEGLDAVAEEWWPRIAVGRNAKAVAETYRPSTRVIYSELLAHGPGRAPELLNFGEMRMEPVFIGFEIPTQAVHTADVAQMAAHSMDLVRQASARGFCGYMNVDSLVTETGELLFTEVNGRMGACTHIDVLARELLGSGYLRSHVLLTRNRVQVPDFGGAVAALAAAGLAFDHETGEGCVICVEGVEATGTLEYIVSGRDSDRAYDIEARAERTLAAMGG